MSGTKKLMSGVVLILLETAASLASQPGHDLWSKLGQERAAYRQQLDAVRREEGGVRKLPPISFSSSAWEIAASFCTSRVC